MRLSHVHVQNFRSIRDETLELDDLTVLVGANGAGKSAFLRALNYFYQGPAGITREDFYNRETGEPVEITATYGALSDSEREAFERYVHADTLSVTLRIAWLLPQGGGEGTLHSSYHGYIRRHQPFDAAREPGSSAAARIEVLSRLKGDKPDLYDFTPESAWIRAQVQIADWEKEHPEHCSVVLDDGSYFKAPNSGGPLGPYTELIFVPAVRDASDEAVESRTNTIGRLVGLVVGDITGSEDIKQLSAEFKTRYSELVEREKAQRLPRLQETLAGALRGYVPYANVSLEWQGADVNLASPRTVVRLEDDGFLGEIENKGHGLQRLFIVSLLQVASSIRAESEGSADTADATRAPEEETDSHKEEIRRYILAVEEPELYQHPMQARRFAQVLDELASGAPGPGQAQVIYSTHSPFFVGVGRFDSIRRVQKIDAGLGLPMVTGVKRATLDEVMTMVSAASGQGDWSAQRFRSGLRAVLDVSVSEGFFAQKIVLVEGPEDKAVVEAGLRVAGVDIDADGIAVIPVEGKTNLARPYAIFSSLGIPCYLIFDGDADAQAGEQKPETNLGLQRLCGEASPAEFPDTGVRPHWTAFRRELTKDIPEEFGAREFYSARDEIARDMGWGEPSRARKNPTILEATIDRMHHTGRRSATLDGIVDAIRALDH